MKQPIFFLIKISFTRHLKQKYGYIQSNLFSFLTEKIYSELLFDAFHFSISKDGQKKSFLD